MGAKPPPKKGGLGGKAPQVRINAGGDQSVGGGGGSLISVFPPPKTPFFPTVHAIIVD